MADPNVADSGLWEWAKWLWSVIFFPIFGYLWKRVDSLDKKSIERSEYNGTIESIRKSMDANHESIRAEIAASRREILNSFQSTISLLKDK